MAVQDEKPPLSSANYEIVALAVDRQEEIVPGLAKPMATGIRNPIVVPKLGDTETK